MNRKNNLVAVFVATIFSVGCNQSAKENELRLVTQEGNKEIGKKIQRFGMVTGLKSEKIAYYKELHANAWPTVQKKITECNIQNYSIFLKEMGGKHYLFSYFEYTGNDFDADMKKMATDTSTQRWWRETDPTQIPLPDAAAKKKTWSNMEEVFHQE